jgi:hypothetical protein
MSTLIGKVARAATAAAVCGVVAAGALMPSAAHAWWVGPYWRPGVVVVGPPVVYGPPPPPYYYHRHWVAGHYDGRGYWIPPHWA